MKKCLLVFSLIVSVFGSSYANGSKASQAQIYLAKAWNKLVGPRSMPPAPPKPKTFVEKLKAFKASDVKKFVNSHRYESAALTAIIATGAYLIFKNSNSSYAEVEDN